MVDLLTGGGERSLGDDGQRGVSLASAVTEGFCGIGALMLGSDTLGYKFGIDVADRALWVAAAEGGLVLVLDDRDGLTSFVLFFLERPGPADREVVVGFTGGRTGDASLDGTGELVADGARRGCSFFGSCVESDGSRVGLGVVDLDGFVLEEAEAEGVVSPDSCE